MVVVPTAAAHAMPLARFRVHPGHARGDSSVSVVDLLTALTDYTQRLASGNSTVVKMFSVLHKVFPANTAY